MLLYLNVSRSIRSNNINRSVVSGCVVRFRSRTCCRHRIRRIVTRNDRVRRISCDDDHGIRRNRSMIG